MELKKKDVCIRAWKPNTDLKPCRLQDDLWGGVEGSVTTPALDGTHLLKLGAVQACPFRHLYRDSVTSLGPKAASEIWQFGHLKKHMVWQNAERRDNTKNVAMGSDFQSLRSCLYEPPLFVCPEELLPACE